MAFYKHMLTGQNKKNPEDVPIYNHMMKLNQETKFGYFIGENTSSLSKKEFEFLAIPCIRVSTCGTSICGV